MDRNYMEQLFVDTINVMADNKWEWPDHWEMDRRIRFLNESLRYAEERELYEQCAIIRDVKDSVEQK